MLNRVFWTNPVNELRREMEQVFDTFGRGSAAWPFRHRDVYPALNIWDEGHTICLEAEIPGVTKEGLEIYAVGNELTLKGRRQPITGEGLSYQRQERGTGEFSRLVTLPVEVEADKIEAVLRDGVLTLRLPKAEKARPRQIAVQAG